MPLTIGKDGKPLITEEDFRRNEGLKPISKEKKLKGKSKKTKK